MEGKSVNGSIQMILHNSLYDLCSLIAFKTTLSLITTVNLRRDLFHDDKNLIGNLFLF